MCDLQTRVKWPQSHLGCLKVDSKSFTPHHTTVGKGGKGVEAGEGSVVGDTQEAVTVAGSRADRRRRRRRRL